MRRVNRQDFAERLARRMKALTIGQSDLARALETKQSTVKNWLQGHIPRVDTLDDLVGALSTSREWLLYGEGPEEVVGPPPDETRIAGLLKRANPAQKKFLMKMLEKMVA